MLNETWTAFLAAAGVAPDPSGASRALSARDGIVQATHAAVICDLSSYGLLHFGGPDAAAFLHAQLSSDVQALGAKQCQLATYNTPKGRVLATLLLWRNGDGFLVQLPATLAEGIRKRLAMYILRAKVKAVDAEDRYVRLGLGGPEAAAVLERAGMAAPPEPFGLVGAQSWNTADSSGVIDYLLHLPGGRYELLFEEPQHAIAAWTALLASGATAAGTDAWRWLTVRSAVPDILPQTQDQFVAQMLNMDLVGAISFTKGCYPGQEIVARTQYRGEIKRRTLLLHSEGDSEAPPGTPIYATDKPDQAVGTSVLSAPAPGGGTDLLACLHLELAGQGVLHLGAADGPEVQRLPLPYALARSA